MLAALFVLCVLAEVGLWAWAAHNKQLDHLRGYLVALAITLALVLGGLAIGWAMVA